MLIRPRSEDYFASRKGRIELRVFEALNLNGA